MMSSTCGTSSMETKSHLQASDICRILKQCEQSGVSELRYLGLHVTFSSRRNESLEKLGQASSIPSPDPFHEVMSATDKIVVKQQDEARLMDEDLLLEAEEAQLLIDDSLAFEKVQIDRHIERARTMNENA